MATAAEQLASAQRCLEVDEDWKKGLETAEAALKLFKELGDQRGAADALREIAASYRTKASAMADLRDKEKQLAALDEGKAVIEKELAAFKEAGDRYGEASMLASMAELEADRPEPSPQVLQEVLASLARARSLLKELGAKKTEGDVCILIAGLQSKRKVHKEATKVSRDALALYQACGDKKGEARAYHSLAACIVQAPATNSQGEALQQGLKHAQKALVLFQECGLKKSEASLLYFVAKWHLLLQKPKDALPVAKKAMELFRELNYGKGWQAESRRVVVTCLMELYRWKEARKVSWEGISHFRESGDKRCLVLGLDGLIILHLEASVEHKGDMGEAMKAAEEAIGICRELGDRKWEANQIFNTAQIHVRDKNWDAAEQAVLEATRLDDEIGEILERVVKLQLLIDIYFRKSLYDKALKVANEVRDTYQGKDKKQEEANACLLVAQCFAAQEDLQRAINSALEAKEIYQAQADNRGEAQAWDLVSRLQRAAGEAEGAAESLNQVKALQQVAGDKKAQAYSLQQSAGLLANMGRYTDSVKAAFEALALARASDDAKAEVEMLMLASQALLGEIMHRAKEATEIGENVQLQLRKGETKALRYAREAVTLGRKLGDDYFTAGAIYAISQIHLMAGRADAGIRSATEAGDMWRMNYNEGGAAYAMLLVAEGHFSKADVKEAESVANGALRIFQDLGEQEGEDKAREALARFAQGPLERPKQLPAAGAAEQVEEAQSAAADAAPTFKALPMEVAARMARETALNAIGAEEEVDMDSPLMDVGLDSLSAIAFREQLISTSGLNVPSSLVFDYPSLQAIAAHLVEISAEQPAKQME